MFGSRENKDLKGIEFCGYKGYTTPNRLSWFNNFNVVIGRNNSGKTSFIDIVHALCEYNFYKQVSASDNFSIFLINEIKNFELYSAYELHMDEEVQKNNFNKKILFCTVDMEISE